MHKLTKKLNNNLRSQEVPCVFCLADLCLALSIPAVYKCPNGTVAGGLEALLILLRRLTYPNRLCDLCQLFGRPEAELSMIIHEVTLFFGGGGGGGGGVSINLGK